MTYGVESDILTKNGKNVKTVDTSKKSGKIKPKFIVIHYTAGSSFESDVNILSVNNKARVSCHLVLSPEGEIVQVGKLNDKLWHAGKSYWKGYNGLNTYSIGIEVTCPGWVLFSHEKEGVKYYTHSLGGAAKWNDRDHTIVSAKHKNGGSVKHWLQFTPEQMKALHDIVPAIMKHYDIEECVGHDMIAPTRKIDPGPCLPEGFYETVNKNKLGKNSTTSKNHSSYKVNGTNGTGLNIRKWPSTKSSIIKNLSEGTEVAYIRAKGAWYLVRLSDGIEGWVSSRYLK